MKVLIIKTGYSETLDGQISETVSYGDVLRTTTILHIFKEDQVTWLTDYKAIPLLEGNPYINQIIPINPINLYQVENEHFDILINLEKVPGLCALAEKVTAWKRFGFRFDFINGSALAYDKSDEALALAGNLELKKNSGKSWVESLYEMMNEKWQGEGYILGYQPKNDIKFDIGLNNKVGPKWPAKQWDKWDELATRLNGRYSVSYQQHPDDITKYIEWINECQFIVTSDSLGAHIAIALNKKVVCLFGPTIVTEVHDTPSLIKLTPPEVYDCIPCLKRVCDRETICTHLITVERVLKAIDTLFVL